MMMMMTMKKKMVMVMISMILMINNAEWFVYHKYDEENDTGWFRWCLITLVHEYDDEDDDDEDVNNLHGDDDYRDHDMLDVRHVSCMIKSIS